MTDTTRYFVETRWGGSEDAPTRARLSEIVRELDTRDPEHPDTWLVHRHSGWSIRLDEEGYAFLSDPDGEPTSHMAGVSRAAGLDLWLRFASGGPHAVKSDPWRPGDRIRADLELAALRAQAEAVTLAADRKFFDLLGNEDPAKPCRKEGCTRGRIQYSALCKAHHFEQLRKKPCPFE